VNDAPTLTTVGTITGGVEDVYKEISYADLAEAANEADIDSSNLSFRVQGVSSGTLQKWDTGVGIWSAVVPGSTLISSGEKVQWKGEADANGELNAFTVRAWDGFATSLSDVQVKVSVSGVNDAPTLTTMSTIRGGIEDSYLEIRYSDLEASSNEADVDGNALSFRVQGLSSGTLQKWDILANSGVGGWSAVVPGSTLISSGEKVQWKGAADANGELNAFTLRAWDGFLPSTSDVQVKVNASAVNDAPTVTGTLANKIINRGSAFTYTVPSGLFTDPDSTLSISAKTATGAALPSWLTFNATTGTFTGTPTSGGTFNLAVAAADELGSVSAPLILNVREVQSVSSSATDIRYQRNKDVSVPINYSTTDGSQTTGLSFKVHFNSSLFSFDPVTGVNNKATADLFQIGAVQSDTSNTDGDATTDKFIPINVASFSGSFPSGATPIKLADLIFKAANKAIDPLTGLKDTKINFSETEAAQGYGFQGTGAFLKPMSFSLDVDGDGKVTALGDGLMVIRHLFGSAFFGSALTDKAISPTSPFLGGATYNTMTAEQKTQVASLVATNIQQGIDAGLLDVDKDGKTTALGDGLMVIRNLFGSSFSGTALIDKAISPTSPFLGGLTYVTMSADQKLAASGLVTANIDALKPSVI
jgi:hypothetical protein